MIKSIGITIILCSILALLAVGCSKPANKPSENGYTDSAVVTSHTGDNYTIRQGRVETHAVCRYSTYNIKGEDNAHDSPCLKALPVGKEIKVWRGEGDWLFADWEEGNTQWHMGLNVEQEEVK